MKARRAFQAGPQLQSAKALPQMLVSPQLVQKVGVTKEPHGYATPAMGGQGPCWRVASSVLPAETRQGLLGEVTFELGLHDGGQLDTRTAVIKVP